MDRNRKSYIAKRRKRVVEVVKMTNFSSEAKQILHILKNRKAVHPERFLFPSCTRINDYGHILLSNGAIVYPKDEQWQEWKANAEKTFGCRFQKVRGIYQSEKQFRLKEAVTLYYQWVISHNIEHPAPETVFVNSSNKERTYLGILEPAAFSPIYTGAELTDKEILEFNMEDIHVKENWGDHGVIKYYYYAGKPLGARGDVFSSYISRQSYIVDSDQEVFAIINKEIQEAKMTL